MTRLDSLSTAKQLLASLVLVLFAALFSSPQSHAQGGIGPAWVAEAQQDGFTLKKVISDTAIATGQSFTYSVYFSIPAGATNVTISDALPAGIEFLAGSFTAPCGTPTVVAPAVNSIGGTYSLTFATLPSGCSGSFTLTVRFPNGTTCNGVTARNRACISGILGPKQIQFCTPFVSTRAIAVEPWNINKYIIGAAYQGGPCPYAIGDSIINYQICVYKNVGTTGQLNLANPVVTDVLPAGAILQSSSCGATQTGNTITWNVLPNPLSALPMYNTVCCTFTVLYPRASFPLGSTVSNKAVLSGTLGSTQTPCGTLSDTSNTTCFEIKNIASATLSKFVYTTGQPGCSGKYQIWVCNNGTTSIASFTITDTIPTTLTGLSMGTVSPGLAATLVGSIVTVNSTSALAPGQCRYFEVNFTIPAAATVGSTITNCAWFTGPGLAPVKACNSFVVVAPAPQACVWKEVCSKLPSYAPGATFRYRMRVQNIGGQPLTGATITDVLNPNLTVVGTGNPSYYTSTNWAAPCQATSTWAGVTFGYNAGTNTVTAALPTIPAVCQSIFYLNCGMYGTGGVTFYFIEFDVKITDTSALGNIPNLFTLSGGTLPATVTSNTELVTVAGTAGYTLDKAVKANPAGTYGTSATVSAGGTIAYRLRMTVPSTSVGLRHITFADLLPIDDSPNPDKLILGPCTPRNSSFNITYALPVLPSTPATTSWNNSTTTFARVNNFQPTGAPAVMFVGGCGTTGTWTSSIPSGAENVGWYFGATPIGALGTATAQMNALIPSNVTDSARACNTFAASAAVRHLINSTIISDQVIGQLESAPVCVTVLKVGPCLDSIQIKVDCKGKDAAGNQQYSIQITGNNGTGAGVLNLSSTEGTFAPSNFVLPLGPFIVNTVFTDTPPVSGGLLVIQYALMGPNGQVLCRDSILRDLPPCPVEPPRDCCIDFIRQIKDRKVTYNNAGGVTLSATIIAGPTPIQTFVASIVGVQLRTKCLASPASAWQRGLGDITGGSLSVPLSPGPNLLSVFSRIARWGPDQQCESFANGVNMSLNMIFPAPPASFKCHDTLIFTMRYTFTDCKCQTCELVVRDTVVRRRTFVPWDNSGVIIPSRFGTQQMRDAKAGEEVQAETVGRTSIVMSDKNSGTLHIINPAVDGNDITVHGVEVTSEQVPLVSIGRDGNTSAASGGTAFIGVLAPPGTNDSVGLLFNNANSLMTFPVDVRFLYTVGTSTTPEFSEVIRYQARVPGGAPDEIGADPTSKPDGVKTYAVFFKNANAYRQRTALIRIKTNGPARILAVGPAGTDPSEALLTPTISDSGRYMISAVEGGEGGVGEGAVVKPIYLTLSDVVGSTVSFDFQTYDVDGNLVSSGTFTLSDPIAGVHEAGDVDVTPIATMAVMPNPAGTSATVSITLNRSLGTSAMTITDINGRTIKTLASGAMDQGNHVISTDVTDMPQGAYFIVLTTPFGTQSLPLNVIK